MRRGRIPCSASEAGTSGTFSSFSLSAWNYHYSLLDKVQTTYRGRAIYCREADIVLLNNTGVQTVKVHDKNKPVIETSLGLENETTLVLVFLFLITRVIVVSLLGLFFRLLQFGRILVRTDVLVPMKLMEQDVLITLSASTTQGSGPGIASDVREHLGQG